VLRGQGQRVQEMNVKGVGFRVKQGLVFGVWCLVFGLQGSGCRVQGAGLRVQSLGFRVKG
jgi:hypothetical protein